MKTEIKPNQVYSELDKSLKKALKFDVKLRDQILDYLLSSKFKELASVANQSLEDPKFQKTLRSYFRRYTSIPYSERGKDTPASFKLSYAKGTILRKNTMLAQKFGMGRFKNSLKFNIRKFEPNEEGQRYIDQGERNPDLKVLFTFGDFRRQLSSTAFSKALCKELATGNYTTINLSKSTKKSDPEKLYISCEIGIKNIPQLLNSQGLSFWSNPQKQKGSRNNQMKATLILSSRHKKKKFDMLSFVLRRTIAYHYKGSEQ